VQQASGPRRWLRSLPALAAVAGQWQARCCRGSLGTPGSRLLPDLSKSSDCVRLLAPPPTSASRAWRPGGCAGSGFSCDSSVFRPRRLLLDGSPSGNQHCRVHPRDNPTRACRGRRLYGSHKECALRSSAAIEITLTAVHAALRFVLRTPTSSRRSPPAGRPDKLTPKKKPRRHRHGETHGVLKSL